MKNETETILAWHFLPSDRKLTYGDGREVKAGKTLTAEGEPVLCENGMHASTDIIDALSFRRGTVLCRVEVSGSVKHGENKVCGKSRKCLAMEDINKILRIWAIDCAEHVLPIYEKRYPENKSVLACIEAARLYLDGKITQAELMKARSAAAAAYAAAYAAAADAADAAAAAAAYAAAADAADAADADAAAAAAAAAYAAAYAAAAARKTEHDWQRARLMELLPQSLKAV